MLGPRPTVNSVGRPSEGVRRRRLPAEKPGLAIRSFRVMPDHPNERFVCESCVPPGLFAPEGRADVAAEKCSSADQLAARSPGDAVAVEAAADFGRIRRTTGTAHIEGPCVVVTTRSPRGSPTRIWFGLRDRSRIGGGHHAMGPGTWPARSPISLSGQLSARRRPAHRLGHQSARLVPQWPGAQAREPGPTGLGATRRSLVPDRARRRARPRDLQPLRSGTPGAGGCDRVAHGRTYRRGGAADRGAGLPGPCRPRCGRPCARRTAGRDRRIVQPVGRDDVKSAFEATHSLPATLCPSMTPESNALGYAPSRPSDTFHEGPAAIVAGPSSSRGPTEKRQTGLRSMTPANWGPGGACRPQSKPATTWAGGQLADV